MNVNGNRAVLMEHAPMKKTDLAVNVLMSDWDDNAFQKVKTTMCRIF